MSYEHDGKRLRVVLGDLNMGEDPGTGGTFKLEVGIGEDLGEHTTYGPSWPKNHRDKFERVSHSLTACLWRWGLYISVAGRRAPTLSAA